MCGMFVNVTGGMSLEVGSFSELGAAAYGIRPVRTIGGCRSVAMAIIGLSI